MDMGKRVWVVTCPGGGLLYAHRDTYVHKTQAQLTERVMAYDPEKEVAVMFAYKGQVRASFGLF